MIAWVGNCKGLVLEHNTADTVPGSPSQAIIYVDPACTAVHRCGNSVAAYTRPGRRIADKGYIEPPCAAV